MAHNQHDQSIINFFRITSKTHLKKLTIFAAAVFKMTLNLPEVIFAESIRKIAWQVFYIILGEHIYSVKYISFSQKQL